ncbi:hypothetical protein C8Q74DRAFT_1197184 [Fomes fomentarius]|nr:hypothetical protein C8Q74DRAFT_1197184 [Fomes fomentarius]
MSLAAWDIYRKSLEPLGHGIPLWSPEPSPTFGEVRLGDVGYIQRGVFCFLFNTTVDASHADNKRGVPEGFEPFTYQPTSVQIYPNPLMQSVVQSEGVQSQSGDTTVTVDDEPLTTKGSQYTCSKESGALLVLNGGTTTTELTCNIDIRNYVLQNISDFARNKLGIDLGEKDLVFVTGFTKTSEWGTIAFHNAKPNSRLIINGGGFAPDSNEEQWHVTMSGSPKAMIFARIGPPDRVARRRNDGEQVEMDQCIFIKTTQVKTDILGRLRAAAGPHCLPRSEDGDDHLVVIVGAHRVPLTG